jgi:hypothetical protein
VLNVGRRLPPVGFPVGDVESVGLFGRFKNVVNAGIPETDVVKTALFAIESGEI